MSSKQRGVKRQVSLSDAFRVEEEDDKRNRPPPDAKLSRNLGGQTPASQGPKTYDRGQTPSSMYWQQEMQSRQGNAREDVRDGSSSLLRDDASGRKEGKSREKAPLAKKLKAAAVEESEGPLFMCWLCKRRFKTNELFVNHTLYSKLHHSTIRRQQASVPQYTGAVSAQECQVAHRKQHSTLRMRLAATILL